MPIPAESPNLRYYLAVEGRWLGSFQLTAARSGGSVLTRLLARAASLLSPLRLETTVDASGGLERAEVIHTTRVSKWGVAFYEATETFALDQNGLDVAVSRRERVLPSRQFRHEQGLSHAKVEPSARRAHYRFSLLGDVLEQTVSIEADGVRVLQQALGQPLRGEAFLRRS
jgi:hypothetical protein